MFCYLTSQVTLDLTSDRNTKWLLVRSGQQTSVCSTSATRVILARVSAMVVDEENTEGQRLLTNNLFQLVVVLGVRPALHDRAGARGRHFVGQCRAKARVLTGAAGAPRQK